MKKNHTENHNLNNIALFLLFQGYDEDLEEKSITPLNECIETIPPEGDNAAIYKAKNAEGRRMLKITNKQEQKYFIGLLTALNHFDCLLPNNLDISLKIYLTEPEKYFTCPTNSTVKPKFKITDCKLIVEYVLLKPNLLQVHTQNYQTPFVNSHNILIGLRYNYYATPFKQYSGYGKKTRKIILTNQFPITFRENIQVSFNTQLSTPSTHKHTYS